MLSLWLISDSPYKFTVQFRQAENYPVDLYYVMDMSHSMNDDKERLALLGELLGECNCYRLIIIIAMVSHIFYLGMYRLSGSSWPDIPPFFNIRLRQKKAVNCHISEPAILVISF